MDRQKIFIYLYALPLLVVLAWTAWRIRSERKEGRKYIAGCIRDCWPLLLPGVSLWGVCALLMIAVVEGSAWLERHWEPWRRIGEQSRRLARWMIEGTKED